MTQTNYEYYDNKNKFKIIGQSILHYNMLLFHHCVPSIYNLTYYILYGRFEICLCQYILYRMQLR